MRCDLCKGNYRAKTISLNRRRGDQRVMIDDVPALVCDRCGDTLLSAKTVKRIEELLEGDAKQVAPLYKFSERLSEAV